MTAKATIAQLASDHGFGVWIEPDRPVRIVHANHPTSPLAPYNDGEIIAAVAGMPPRARVVLRARALPDERATAIANDLRLNPWFARLASQPRGQTPVGDRGVIGYACRNHVDDLVAAMARHAPEPDYTAAAA